MMIDGAGVGANWPDLDLWLIAQQVIRHQLPAGAVRITWMPSHLDDKKAKRDAALASGAVSYWDIEGNNGADALAQRGRDTRMLPEDVRWGLIDRAFVAKRVHTFLLET